MWISIRKFRENHPQGKYRILRYLRRLSTETFPLLLLLLNLINSTKTITAPRFLTFSLRPFQIYTYHGASAFSRGVLI